MSQTRPGTVEGPPEAHELAERWPMVKFRVPPTWKAELDAIARERAISLADLGRMIFREWLAPRLSA